MMPSRSISSTPHSRARSSLGGALGRELDPAVRTTWAGFSVGGAAAPSF
jgi:hypothetical protein